MIEVACAIIEFQQKVLVTRRSRHKQEGGLWEFPGGKLEVNESAATCIVREIREELELQVFPYQQLKATDHHYPGKIIRLIPLVCQLQGGTLQLKDHDAYQWLPAKALPGVSWCPADVAVVNTYLQWLSANSAPA